MTDEEFKTEVLSRLEDIRALYKKHCPNAFVEGKEQSGYMSLTIFNHSVSFGNGSMRTCKEDGIPYISAYREIDMTK